MLCPPELDFEFVVSSGLPEHSAVSPLSLDEITGWHICHSASAKQLGEGVLVVPRVP